MKKLEWCLLGFPIFQSGIYLQGGLERQWCFHGVVDRPDSDCNAHDQTQGFQRARRHSKNSKLTFFLKQKNWRTFVLFVTSGDVSSGFQSGSLIHTLWRRICYTFPQIHLWCDTCQPLSGHHGSQAVLFHVPASRHWFDWKFQTLLGLLAQIIWSRYQRDQITTKSKLILFLEFSLNGMKIQWIQE